MSIDQIFEDFLERKVNLNENRLKQIKKARRVLPDFIENQEEFEDRFVDSIPQGSFRQGTIIKPIGNNGDFDVDLLLEIQEEKDWGPADYINNLANIFKGSDLYVDITDTVGKNRCVTIDYKGDFHVDLVPSIKLSDGHYVICNKKTDQFEPTDGDGYAQWFEDQNDIANGNLVEVVRLIKYLRDANDDFDTKSIILTTISGKMVQNGEDFETLSASLRTILIRMNEFIASHSTPPDIENPAPNTDEKFKRNWKYDQRGFERLKSALSEYAQVAREAGKVDSAEEKAEIWQEIFGDSFYPKGQKSSKEAVPKTKNIRSFTPQKQYAQ